MKKTEEKKNLKYSATYIYINIYIQSQPTKIFHLYYFATNRFLSKMSIHINIVFKKVV